MYVDWLIWWFVALIVVGLIGVLLFQLSPDARLRRRRRKSHARIVAKSRRPMVRFSVRPPRKEK